MSESIENKSLAKAARGLMRAPDNEVPPGHSSEVLELQGYHLPRDKFDMIPSGTRFTDSGAVNIYIKGRDDEKFKQSQRNTDLDGNSIDYYSVAFYDGTPHAVQEHVKPVGKSVGHRQGWDMILGRNSE